MSDNDEFNDDILRPLSTEEAKYIIDIYSKDIPEYLQPTNVLSMFLNCTLIMKNPVENIRNQIASDRYRVKLFTHRYGRPDNCTVVTISERADYRVYATSKDQTELMECLCGTKRINFDWNPMFFAFEYCHRDGFNYMILERNLEILMDRPNVKYFMHRVDAANLPVDDIPDDVHLDCVRSEDAEMINDLYPLKTGDTFGYIMTMLRLYPSVGVFLNGTNELVAWVFVNEHYAIGLVFLVFFYTFLSF